MNEQDLIAMSQMNAWGTPALYEGQPQGFAPQQPPPQPALAGHQPGGIYPGATGGAPQQGGFDLNAFLGSPSYAAAMGSINNISRMNRDQPPINVMDQYQQSVRQNAALRIRQEQQRRMEEEHKRRDPFFKFEEAKRRGHIPEDMSWSDFQQMEYKRGRISDTASQKDLRTYMALNPQREGESDEDFQQRISEWFDSRVRAPQMGSIAGGRFSTNPLTGATTWVIDPATGQRYEVDLASGVEGGKKWAAANQAWETAFTESAPALQSTINETIALRDLIAANPDMSTGMIEGTITPKIDELVAYVDTMSSQLTVPALAAAKLNPITEAEWRQIKSTFADAKRDPQANVAALNATINWLATKAQTMQEMQQHYMREGSMEGYAPSFEFDLPARQGVSGAGEKKAVGRFNPETGKIERY
jgi:hypothetical protein